MTKIRLIRRAAVVGSAASAIAYVGFLMAGLNGGGPHLDDLWGAVFFAPAHVLVAWAIFWVLGVIAFAFRSKLADHLLLLSAGLVGLPFLWTVAMSYLYYDWPREIWPSFQDDAWRWHLTYIYAEFALGIFLGFIGLAATALTISKPAET
ncbi:hypothetical protein [Brevundimonas sp. CEF1]|uniref:hypothetical protein n=1 Tax=Brevundimonas sp. CEF1 TaxID=3442642 RepID=UPI003F511C5E